MPNILQGRYLGMSKRTIFNRLRVNNQTGMVLLTSLLIFILLTFVGLSLADMVIAQHGRTARNVSVTNSLLTAEAGVEQAMYEINEDDNFAGTVETEFFNDSTKGRGTYQIAVTNGSGPNEKIITSTGRVYSHNQTTNPISERAVRVTVVGTTSANYSVYTGPGGLNLSGNAAITNSDVYVNGTLSLSGNASIGTQQQPRNVSVAHLACPTGSNPGPTYPQVCSSGQPISMGGNSRIYGSVCATNQTDSSDILSGSGGQGLILGCVAPPVSTPTYDRAAQISAVATTGSANNSTYTCTGNQNKTWPADLRLNGNVNLSGNCQLTVTGNVYITGNFNTSASIRIADSLGSTRPVIIVDGNINVSGNAGVIPNSSGTSAHFISFRSTATCNPNCTSVTGTDLKSSQELTTVDVSGNGSFPGVIFQSYWSRIVMSGNGLMGAAIGQTINLSGNGTIVFGETLASGESTWTIRSYQQVFN